MTAERQIGVRVDSEERTVFSEEQEEQDGT